MKERARNIMETRMTKTEEIRLPELFVRKMKLLLGEEYEAFAANYERERSRGIRFHETKTKGVLDAVWAERYGLKKVPWAAEGYEYGEGFRPGRHPLHEAGVYYIQEPSAMAVTELLDPKPGEYVLDLCAAPGGKTTHIGDRLRGRGLLVSNEIHPARAKILSQNVERMGLSNVVVTNEDAQKLVSYFPEFFDRIAVDAPCSGEGMFRKDENARAEWSQDHVIMCAARQDRILDQAASMLRPGGRLVYSTCTFSPEENEGSIQRFLNRHPEFAVEELPGDQVWAGFAPGRPDWTENGSPALAHTFRLWPHRVDGEGHFMAVLKKGGEGRRVSAGYREPVFVRDRQILNLYRGLEQELFSDGCGFGTERLVLFGDQLYRLPEGMPDFSGLRVLRPGLHLGTIKKNRMEPAHALALACRPDCFRQWYRMDGGGDEATAFLRGEAIRLPGACAESRLETRGWVLMTVDGFGIGWAKLTGDVLKNHYPKGLRLQI